VDFDPSRAPAWITGVDNNRAQGIRRRWWRRIRRLAAEEIGSIVAGLEAIDGELPPAIDSPLDVDLGWRPLGDRDRLTCH
jgi:hypothetical protein